MKIHSFKIHEGFVSFKFTTLHGSTYGCALSIDKMEEVTDLVEYCNDVAKHLEKR